MHLYPSWIFLCCKNETLTNTKNLACLFFTVRNCSGICMAERIAMYCDAILNIDSLCKPGLRCCVSRDSFANGAAPAELQVIDRTKSNLTRVEEHVTVAATSTLASSTAAVAAAATTQRPKTTPPPSKPGKPCKGECVNGFLAFMCDSIDTEADCGESGYCCPKETKQVRPPAR